MGRLQEGEVGGKEEVAACGWNEKRRKKEKRKMEKRVVN